MRVTVYQIINKLLISISPFFVFFSFANQTKRREDASVKERNCSLSLQTGNLNQSPDYTRVS